MTVNLTTEYLGFTLPNPILASASPLTGDLEALARLEQAGVAAAVLPSLFEEQITGDELRLNALYEYQSHVSAESHSFLPELRHLRLGPDEYLKRLVEAKRRVSIPVIASLNGSSPGGWVRYAKLLEDSGADAIELNIYFVPTDPQLTSFQVESRYVDHVAAVKSSVSVPIAVKLGPHFTNLANFIPQLAAVGADGIVLFNRYLEPDIDLELLRVSPHLVLSDRREIRLLLRWIAILRPQTSLSIAATSGVHEPQDALKLLLVGADVCMVASSLLQRGPEHAARLIEGIREWLADHDYESVEQLKGSMSYGNCPDSGALERANYMKALASYTAAL
jgi:dihydroorotate dehydrogenase (fumarate)